MFLYRFDNAPELVEGWTRDKRRISESLGRIQPRGSTALYDAVADAVPLAQQGHNRKKAVVIISDGNDTSSRTDVFAVKQLIRETEVLVYAIGIDAARRRWLRTLQAAASLQQRGAASRAAHPAAVPDAGRTASARRRRRRPCRSLRPGPTGGGGSSRLERAAATSDDRVNVAALRDITDDSGGRTEIVRWARDLDPAVAGIADELSKQYYLGYAATGAKDGRWHTIRVEVRQPAYTYARGAGTSRGKSTVAVHSYSRSRSQSSSQFESAASNGLEP